MDYLHKIRYELKILVHVHIYANALSTYDID